MDIVTHKEESEETTKERRDITLQDSESDKKGDGIDISNGTDIVHESTEI